jgi:hypothetical protein
LLAGISKEALKLEIDALRTESGVDHYQGVGRILKELFEKLAAKIEIFLTGCAGSRFDRVPGQRCWFDGGGDARRNKRRCGSALK